MAEKPDEAASPAAGPGDKPRKPGKKRLPLLMRYQQVEGILITVIIFYLGYYHLQPLLPLPENADFSSKLQYVIYCCIIPCCMFVLSISSVLMRRRRASVPNPLGGQEHLVQVEHNIAQNTLEQLTVFLGTTAILATYLVGDELKLIPLNSLVFTVGRILFQVGYRIHPKYRGVGVACGFSGQVLILSLCVYFLYTRGVMYGLEERVTQTTPATEGLPKQEL